MKKLFSLLAAALTCVTSQAQLVHLHADGTVIQKFGGESWWSGSGDAAGAPAALDLYYEANLPADPGEPGVPARTYRPGNPLNNRWRIQFGAVDITAPFDTIQVTDSGLSVYFADLANGFSTLDLRLTFTSDPSPGFELPRPPFPSLGLPSDPELPWSTSQSTWAFDTGSGFGLEEGGLQVRVDRVTGEIRSFQPVPEPSTYAVSALLLIGATLIMKHRRRAGRRSAVA